MNTTYAQKKAPAQRKDANTAASVIDSSSQAQNLQRKADLCNSPIQCYGMTDGFRENHSYCKNARKRCLNRGQKNSVLTRGAQNKLNGANANVDRIVGVNCATWYYNNGDPYKKEGENYCAVFISGGNMYHLEESDSKMAARVPGWIDYEKLQ